MSLKPRTYSPLLELKVLYLELTVIFGIYSSPAHSSICNPSMHGLTECYLWRELAMRVRTASSSRHKVGRGIEIHKPDSKESTKGGEPGEDINVFLMNILFVENIKTLLRHWYQLQLK